MGNTANKILTKEEEKNSEDEERKKNETIPLAKLSNSSLQIFYFQCEGGARWIGAPKTFS